MNNINWVTKKKKINKNPILHSDIPFLNDKQYQL